MSGRYGANDIFVFGLDGVPLRTVGGAGSGPGEFKASGGGVAAHGDLCVADFYNHRVHKFSPNGAFLTTFGDKGEGSGRLTYAMGVAMAADGSVFVTDFGNHRITKWRPGKTGG